MAEYLASIGQVRPELTNINASTANIDETVLLDAIRFASARVSQLKQTNFEPLIETREFDARGSHISQDGRILFLSRPLLSVTSITLGDGTSLSASDYVLKPNNVNPYTMIQLKQSTGYSWRSYSTSWEQSIVISAVWAYHDNYAGAWATGGTINNAESAVLAQGATSVTVTNGTNFSPGVLVKCENEYIRVTAVSSNTLTIQRGQNGSTDAQHAHGTAITIWQPFSLVNRAVIRWAAFLYGRRGAFESSRIEGTGIVLSFPPDAPPEVTGILSSFRNSIGFGVIG